METCFFQPSDCNKNGKCQSFKVNAVFKIAERSKEKGDDYHKLLNERLSVEGNDIVVFAHKSWYCTYTSATRHDQRAKKRKLDGVPSRTLKSNTQEFALNRDCLLCGEQCKAKDKKHSNRWERVIQCRTVEKGVGNRTFQETLESVCKERNDDWSKKVSLRLAGVKGDLHASDAQYHKRC